MPGAGTEQAVGTGEVVDICRDLIRIDTTNTGDTTTGAGERVAAEYVAGLLEEVGLKTVIRESAPGRTSVLARFEAAPAGGTPARDALLVHAHLDVVPADADEWSVHPLSGEIRDGFIWGRGAVDMKDFNAIVLATVRRMRRAGLAPARDVILAFVADEEAGGTYGSHWLVDNHRDEFDGATEAIGEVGGFSHWISDQQRLYFIQTAEKGITWVRLHARGRPGHGSLLHDDNAVTALAETVALVGRHRFPIKLTEPVLAMLAELARALGFEYDPDQPHQALERLAVLMPVIGSSLRNTANPTRLAAGYKENVIPGRASATIDCRTLPGEHESFLDQLRELIGTDLQIEVLQRQQPVVTSFDGDLVGAMTAALRAEDPTAYPVPYLLAGATDAKAFARLGMRCFGFVPLRLPAGLDFAALFHGIDERVPIDGLEFGTRVLERVLRTC